MKGAENKDDTEHFQRQRKLVISFNIARLKMP